MVAGRHLLIPMQPTPNGRLHVGHGGGPYLRADVMARALRRHGHEVSVITGSDAYENWVLADGAVTGRSPEQTCALFHAGIKADLDNLGIQLDEWINPLDDRHAVPYIAVHESLLDRLRRSGSAHLESEQVPISSATGSAVVGTWLAGRCPNCQAACGGNTCTACGDHFQPEEISAAYSRMDGTPIAWTQRNNWFLRPADPEGIVSALVRTGLPARFLSPVMRYAERRGGRIRLTHPGDWGIHGRNVPEGSVLTNTYYAYSVYCAQVHAQISGNDRNSLAADSDVIVVGLFGTDNSIAGLVAPHAITQGDGALKAFDHTIVNHMLHYEGIKCSTSKRHGLWISPLIERTSITTDELRYVLCHAPLDEKVGNLTSAGIVHEVNRLRQWRMRHLLSPHATAGSPAPALVETLTQTLDRQLGHLNPSTFNLSATAKELDQWLFDLDVDRDNSVQAGTWLLGVALLAAPIMPDLSATLWQGLGFPDQPTMDIFDEDQNNIHIRPIGRSLIGALPREEITAIDVTTALPDEMQRVK